MNRKLKVHCHGNCDDSYFSYLYNYDIQQLIMTMNLSIYLFTGA